jgi:hypothetical protein
VMELSMLNFVLTMYTKFEQIDFERRPSHRVNLVGSNEDGEQNCWFDKCFGVNDSNF